jgi:hypothetical protein
VHELLEKCELLQELQAPHLLHDFVLEKNALVVVFLQDECNRFGVGYNGCDTDCILGVVFLQCFLPGDLVLCQNSQSNFLLTRNNILVKDVNAALTTVYDVHTVAYFSLLHNYQNITGVKIFSLSSNVLSLTRFSDTEVLCFKPLTDGHE